jgi:hypothetical protein
MAVLPPMMRDDGLMPHSREAAGKLKKRKVIVRRFLKYCTILCHQSNFPIVL